MEVLGWGGRRNLLTANFMQIHLDKWFIDVYVVCIYVYVCIFFVCVLCLPHSLVLCMYFVLSFCVFCACVYVCLMKFRGRARVISCEGQKGGLLLHKCMHAWKLSTARRKHFSSAHIIVLQDRLSKLWVVGVWRART